jgi:hypothetical protein
MARADFVPPYAPIRLIDTRLFATRLALGWLVGLVCLVLVLTGSAVSAAPPAASGSPPTLDAQEPAVAADERSALAAAAHQGQRVEIRSARTEYSQTFATPRGTLLVEEYVRPQWVRAADGSWVDADPTLVRAADGSWVPRAVTAAMSFSGGGEAPLASISAGGSSMALRWPTALPAPVVDGNVATYPNVVPGVDLRVVADVDGFTHLVVIHSPKAAEELPELTLATELSGASLRESETGDVEAVNAAGEVVISGPSPTMWDSRDAAGGVPEAGEAPLGIESVPAVTGVEPALAPVAVDVSAGGLTMTPDAGLLADPATVFPVAVSKTWAKATGKRNNWSLLRKSFPSSSFYNPAIGSTSSSDGTRGIVRAGFVVEDRTYTDRSVFNMSISAVRNRNVHSAEFSLTQAWSYYNCGSSTRPVTELRSVGSFSRSSTWNNQPSWGGVLATSNKIRKYGYSCGPQRVEYNVTSRVRSAANAGSSSVNLGLRARSESTGSWTRFKLDAKLSIEYNSAPNAPDRLKVQGKDCGNGKVPYVTVSTPSFSARISDRDSGQQSFTTTFYWWRDGGQRVENDNVHEGSSNPSTVISPSIPASKALVDRQLYRLRVKTNDRIDDAWSSTCQFRAWLTPPNAPSDVVSSTYPEYDPANPGLGSGGVGTSGSFTISPPTSGLADVVGYAYTLDSGVPASAAKTVAKGANGSAVVTVTPNRAGENVQRVWSKDVAGLFSSVVEYRFLVRAGNGPAARWLFDDPVAAGADDTGFGNTVSLQGNATLVPGRAGVGQALSVDGSGDAAVTAGPLAQTHPDTGAPVAVRTDATFTVAAQGARTSAFQLGYYGTGNRWRFVMAATDTDNPSLASVLSDAAPTAGRWTHLAGTYDPATHLLRLYVNGVAQSTTATLGGGFNATGPVTIGRRLWNGSPDSYFNGQIDDVRIYSYQPLVAELQAAAKPLPPVISFPDGDTAPVGGTLRVRFDAAGDTNITSFRYSVGDDDLDQSVALGTAGGTATVSVPASAAGELAIVAATVDRLGQQSAPVEAIATVTGAPEVSGVVYDQASQQPVAGATVSLDELGLSVTTGADGRFRFTGFTAGTYILAASIGGQCGMAAVTEVEIQMPVVVDLSLAPARDGFGYECFDVPGTPFAPVGGSVLALTGDDAVAQVSLPFAFPFYGQPQTTAWVDTNGIITFEDPAGPHPGGDVGIPSPAEPDALVAAYWADLVVDTQASVRTQVTGTAPRRNFAVEWRNVSLKGDPNTRLSVQAVLSEDGWVRFNYTGLDTAVERGQEAVVGIESPGGQAGVQYAYKQSVLANDLQVVIAFPPEPDPITTVDLSGAVVDAATGQPAAGVQVLLEPAGLSVTSGPDGGFAFEDLEAGSYTVEAKTRSHCGKTSQVYVELESPADVQLDLVPIADEYGYTCLAGPRGFLPTSTTLELSGDDLNAQVALPFPFTLYGESHSQVWVNTNGILVFAPESYSWHQPMDIPAVQLSPSPAIYPFWADWVVDEAISSVRTGIVGTAPNRQFVIEWRNVHHAVEPAARVSFQVVLHETSHQIAVAWNEIDATNPVEQGSLGVVGIEDADGTIGLPYQEFDQAIASGQGVLFTPGDPGLHQISGQLSCAGSPVAGADVRVGEQTTVTDAQGGFSFAAVPPGPQGLAATAATGACAGSVAMPVTAVRGEPEFVEIALPPVAEAVGYTVTRPGTSMLPANTVVSLPGTGPERDDEYTQVTPPFPVKLYGQSYTQAWVDTNGYLSFADPGDSFAIPVAIPSTDVWAPRPAVFPFWNDWVVDSQASIRTGVSGTAPNRRWVVEWRDVYPYPYAPWQRVSFQAVFDETTGRITFAYTGIDAMFVERGGAGLSGLQNAAGTAAIEYSHLAPVLRSGRGLVLTPVS